MAFKEVLALITRLFPAAKSSVSLNVDVSSWFEDFGLARRRNPGLLLSIFSKLGPVMSDIEEKFCKSSNERKKATSCLPVWGDGYHLGNIKEFHRAPRINESFSRHLEKQVSSLRFVSMTLDECSKLESCVCGLMEAQSSSFWALPSAFAFLKEAGCASGEENFHCLVSSLNLFLSSQAKAAFSVSAFMKQKHRKTLVSHLPASTHSSVKHALLTAPSKDTLFAKKVIGDSLTQVREDSHLTLMKNFSSNNGDKGLASSTSTPSQRKGSSSASLSSFAATNFLHPSTWNQRGSKRSASPSPSRCPKSTLNH